MDWLLDNPVANMYGPKFLLLYVGLAVFTILACRLAIRGSDPTKNLPPLPVPSNPDPYEIAYLRGGENEVTRLIIFNLIQRKYLKTTDGEKNIARETNNPD